jgi:hypothetical protein
MKFDEEFSRAKFLKFSLKLFALTSLTYSGINCKSSLNIPKLKEISEEEYLNIHSVGEIFLKGNPIKNFDIGIALDEYISGKPYPIPTKDKIHELALLPSSLLAALILDYSLTPLVKLSTEEREKRLLSWKNSDSQIKRGAFAILKQCCMFLLSSNKEFQMEIGYNV